MSIQLKNLHIGYKDKTKSMKIAGPIEAIFKTGSLNSIVGLNGTGKTTLIKTISNIIPALEGAVYIQDFPIKNLKPTALSRLISIVLTNSLASENLTVLELVSFGRHPYSNWFGRLKKTDHSAIEESLIFTSLKEMAHKKFHELSDGQKQKALIARALAQGTPYMILDEPMAHLDLHHKAQLLNLLKKLVKEKGKTIILSTHDIEMALSYSDKLLVFNQGTCVTGSPKELTKAGVFNSLFPKDFVVFKEDTMQFSYKGLSSK